MAWTKPILIATVAAFAPCSAAVGTVAAAPPHQAQAVTANRPSGGDRQVTTGARLPLLMPPAPFVSPPRIRHGGMRWYRWRPAAASHSTGATRFGSTAVIGLESMRDLASLRALYGFEPVRAIPALRATEVRVNAEQLRALLDEAPADPRVRYVSPTGQPLEAMSMPNDPLVQTIDRLTGQYYEWQFAASHVDRALELSRGDPSVVVGVIDTGVADVPDLEGKIDGLWSVVSDGRLTSASIGDGNDDNGHGTAVASLIAANVDDGFGMAGFGGATHVIGVHAGKNGVFSDTSVAIALMKLDALGVRIVNISFGGKYPSQPILIDAIHKAAADGILLVAAAGNAHGDVSWPAAALQPSGGGRSFGLAVGASDFDGGLAKFSNAGKHLSLVAPGNYEGTCFSGVLVAMPPANAFEGYYCHPLWEAAGGAKYGYVPGTSFAAPEVAGVAALIWAARPQLENFEVADIIKQSARRYAGSDWTPTMGCGVLDAGAALELTMSRSAAGWAARDAAGSDVLCSVDEGQPAAWPTEANQTITFASPRKRSVTDPDFKVSATASSGLPVSLAASGACTIRRATVHITGAGRCAITASQSGNADYNPARDATQTFWITKRT